MKRFNVILIASVFAISGFMMWGALVNAEYELSVEAYECATDFVGPTQYFVRCD